MQLSNQKLYILDTLFWLGVIPVLVKTCIRKAYDCKTIVPLSLPGPGWLNELGSWIT
jgi:hypothetical protein